MKTHISSPVAIITAISLLTGCAADKHARTLALATSQNLSTYQNAVDAKIEAERSFYHTQLDALRKVTGGYSDITDTNGSTSYSIERTISYGRIRTGTEREARLTAEAILLQDRPALLGPIIAYLDRGLETDQKSFLESLSRQRELASQLADGLAPVEQQAQAIDSVRKLLSDLSQRRSIGDQLSQYYSFGKAVADQIKKDQKQLTSTETQTPK